MTVGFIGMGTMGTPMASNLLHAGVPLVVWNRTREKCAPLEAAGAQVAASVAEVFSTASTVLLMLLNEQAIDAVLDRGRPGFDALVAGKTLVNLGTISAEYSRRLEADLLRAGGLYVEAPVSGSRLPAERGALVGMLAGHGDPVTAVRPLLEPICAKVFHCGAVPNAVRTKLAVNHYLITMVAALGETFHAARAAGIDLAVLQDVLDAGPMASEVSRIKFDKLVRGDYSAQASVHDAGKIARLAYAQAVEAGARAPLLDRSIALYRAAEDAGWRSLDMIAATRTLEQDT